MTESPQPKSGGSGFDAAVSARDQDHLNRWPFAKEIYGIATTGPREWSVRIGIYGEWGTGKTSVLNFVETMAAEDEHVVVRFNPWEFTDRRGLWHGFVQAVTSALPETAFSAWSARRSRWKKWGAPVARFISQDGGRLSAAVDDKRVTLGLFGIDLLKDFILSNRRDLDAALVGLGNKRLVVLIDDLDRTDPKLVPEILFALKEIMGTGGFSFICSFDPVVVGEVLGHYHPGFKDGLKFLEKIIDYPRWLSVPSHEGLVSMAVADTATYCPAVPPEPLKDALSLLPPNPRKVRQFVRLLALLQEQIDRHYPHELNWSLILAANAFKVRFPRVAPTTLGVREFWDNVYTITLMNDNDADEKLSSLVETHVQEITKLLGEPVADVDIAAITSALLTIAKRLDAWTGMNIDGVLYQVCIAESPAAVTWKEFDGFIKDWQQIKTADAADRWMKQHSEAVGRTYQEVYLELLDATVRGRHAALGQAAEVLVEEGMTPQIERADIIMGALKCLTLDLGNLNQEEKRLGESQFEQIYKAINHYLAWTSSELYRGLRKNEKAYILALTDAWAVDVTPLVHILKPFSHSFERDLGGAEAKALHKELCDVVVPRYALQVLQRFSEQGFIRSVYGQGEGTYEARSLLLDPTGPLWGALRKESLAMLATAKVDMSVHHGAYELLLWFDYTLRKEPHSGEGDAVQAILKDDELCKALWAAAIAHPLNPRAVGSLRELPAHIRKLGGDVSIPEWWKNALNELGVVDGPAIEDAASGSEGDTPSLEKPSGA